MTSLELVVPVFTVRDLAAALDHYARLGFTTHAGSDTYGFAQRDGVWLHLSVIPDLDPTRSVVSAYLYVEDADALHREWRASGAGGRFHDPIDTDYGLREGAHIDPDGNLLRVGSWLPGRRPA
jgi:hypothetical protein